MKQYFIFTDIDGTLFHQNKILPSTLLALRKAKENGHQIFLSSGRCYPDIDPIFKELPLDGMVLGCGGQIVLHNETVFYEAMPKEVLLDLIQFFINHDIGFSCEGAHKIFLYGDAYFMYRSWLKYLVDDEMNDESLKEFLLSRNTYDFSLMKDEDYNQIIKMSFFAKDKKPVEEYIQHLDKRVFGYFDNLSPILFTGEFYMKDINKAKGMDYILKHFQHPLEATIALGDSLNDKEMIEHAAIGIAMGNACDELKQIADHITEDINEDGFYNALKHFKII
ncbi:MAG: HAD family hydrolase [Traorella sp.]